MDWIKIDSPEAEEVIDFLVQIGREQRLDAYKRAFKIISFEFC